LLGEGGRGSDHHQESWENAFHETCGDLVTGSIEALAGFAENSHSNQNKGLRTLITG